MIAPESDQVFAEELANRLARRFHLEVFDIETFPNHNTGPFLFLVKDRAYVSLRTGSVLTGHALLFIENGVLKSNIYKADAIKDYLDGIDAATDGMFRVSLERNLARLNQNARALELLRSALCTR
jgi:hypothetical protein